jgi:hypothetical protein
MAGRAYRWSRLRAEAHAVRLKPALSDRPHSVQDAMRQLDAHAIPSSLFVMPPMVLSRLPSGSDLMG